MKRTGYFRKTKNRLTFWFLVISILPMAFAAFYMYLDQTKEIKQTSYNKLKAICDLKVERLNNWIAERKGDLNVTSRDYDITDIENVVDHQDRTKKDIEVIDKVRVILQNYKNNFPDYEELFVMEPHTGKILVSTREYDEGVDKSDNSLFYVPQRTRKLFIKDIYYSKDIKDYAMGFSIPIFCRRHSGEHLVGILAARVNLDNSLIDIFESRTGLGETGELVVVNKDLLALNRLKECDDSILKTKVDFDSAIKAVNGETGITECRDHKGKKVLAAYTNIPETGWGFICKQNMDEIKIPLKKLFIEFVLIVIIIGVVIAIVSIILGKAISKPLVELKNMARKIEYGDYSVRNSINKIDEIGILAKSVNTMAESLESQAKVQIGIQRITSTLMENPNLLNFGKKLLHELMELSNSEMGVIYSLSEDKKNFVHLTSIGSNELLKQSFSSDGLEGEMGTVIAARRIYYFKEIPLETRFVFVTISGDLKPKEIISIPVLSGDEVVALISLANIHAFKAEFIDSLNMSWNAINKTYSNILFVEKTRKMAFDLKRSNDQLAAQADELQAQSEELQQQSVELQRSSMELHEQNMELEAQKTHVMEATRLKSEFLSNMSHELRTPLNSVLALSEILIQRGKGKLNDEEIEFLEIIERNGRRLLYLINDILDFSKIEAGKLDIIPARISVNHLIENIRSMLKPLADKKELILMLDLADNSPVLETDEVRLHQIVQNIAGNAVKFTEKGFVKFTTRAEGGLIRIIIEDSGIGIPADKLPYIFDEFRQLDGSTSRQYEGTGLGLAIAGKLIKLLHGEIEVMSDAGAGSIFTITLPEKWQGDEDIEFVFTEPHHSEDDLDNQAIQGNQRLLLVEDNETSIIQMKTVLLHNGYQVSVVKNGLEALKFVDKTIPDGIILDLMMPEMDGFEVLENIRSREETKEIPVLILTAKDLTSSDLARLSANNIQQLVLKGDIDLKGLLSKIKVMLLKSSGSRNVYKFGDKTGIGDQLTNKQSILIIEGDTEIMSEILKAVPAEYRILKASDGFTGLRIAISQKPDLVLLNVNLPKMSGIELIGMLKKTDENDQVAVIAIIDRTKPEDENELEEAGCDDYLIMPIDPEILTDKIKKWLK